MKTLEELRENSRHLLYIKKIRIFDTCITCSVILGLFEFFIGLVVDEIVSKRVLSFLNCLASYQRIRHCG